jgi:hypothetical protein
MNERVEASKFIMAFFGKSLDEYATEILVEYNQKESGGKGDSNAKQN